MTTGSDRLRVLCISPEFVPVPGSRAICASKLVKALVDQGLEATVIYDDTMNRGPGRVREESACWETLRGRAVPAPPSVGPRLLHMAISAIRWRAMGGFAGWVDQAILKAMELHARKPFDFIYSFSVPVWAHIVGYWCSRRTGLPWAMDISDPWDLHQWPAGSQASLPVVRQIHANLWEKACMRRASLVTYPSERLARRTHEFVHPPKSWIVLPHIGYAPPSGPEPDGIFRLIHTGVFSYGRSARALLAGLHRFLEQHPEARERTKLTLVGPVGDPVVGRLTRELGLLSQVTTVSEVCYERSLEYVGAATVCVLVEARFAEGIFLPSKVVDYIAARKPIIALSPAVGTLNDMSGDPGIFRVDADDVEGVAAALGLLWQDFRGGTLDRRRPSRELARRFDASSVAKRFVDALPGAGITRRGDRAGTSHGVDSARETL